MNPSTMPICPKCHAPVPAGAPLGLCPKCVLQGAATNADDAKPSSHSASQPTVAEIAPHFPELEILEVIGVGGMGVVFKARQPKLDRLVALKILSRELAGDPAFTERFDREARVLARLNHPNIVTVFDCGMAGPFAYLMMEFVDGVNLRQAMQTGRFKPAEALALVQDVCGALKFAHERDILHRDIKPENILIDSRGQVKIADFGIAKLVGENERGNVTLTQQGAVLGSPRYMAPEQFDSPGDVDQRADIYSLGVVLYELLTGELPMGRFAPPSKKSSVDARIDEIVMRTLERERELRFQTVGEVKTQMEAAKDAKPAPLQTTAGDQRPNSVGEIARHATAAAVCTGASLLLVPSLFIRSASVRPAPVSQPVLAESASAGPEMLTLLVVALAVLTPLIGIGLGISSLRDIRESNGQRLGFVRSMFGTLAWPVLFIFGAAGVLIARALEKTGSRDGLLLIVLTILLGTPFAVLLVHRVAKWVRGEMRSVETGVEATLSTARFANIAAIWTALSLLGGCFFIFTAVIFVERLFDERYKRYVSDYPVFLVFALMLIVPTAGLGIWFAKRSLCQIRDTGGKLAGVTRAKFAALAWPWALIVIMFGAGIVILFDENVLGMTWKLPVSLLLLTGSVLGVVMSRRFSYWVNAESPAKPVRGHVWRFAITAFIALTCLGGYIGQRSMSMQDYLKERGVTIKLKITIPAKTTMHFKVIRVDAEGKETPLDLQSSMSAPDDTGIFSTLELDWTERWKKSDRQKLTATLPSLHGVHYSRSIFLDDVWKISSISAGSAVAGIEKQRFEFATRHDWFGRKLETLYIEAEVTKKQP